MTRLTTFDDDCVETNFLLFLDWDVDEVCFFDFDGDCDDDDDWSDCSNAWTDVDDVDDVAFPSFGLIALMLNLDMNVRTNHTN